jgi:hypothetical protein
MRQERAFEHCTTPCEGTWTIAEFWRVHAKYPSISAIAPTAGKAPRLTSSTPLGMVGKRRYRATLNQSLDGKNG